MSREYQNVRNETMNKVGDKITTWREHLSKWSKKWVELFRVFFGHETKEFPFLNLRYAFGDELPQLFLRRSGELFKNLIWIQECVMSGAYHQAIRELRYILETMIQSYYLDTNHPHASGECKLEILKALESFKSYVTGTILIEQTDLDNKKKLKKLYKNLSGYVHPSPAEMQSQSAYTSFNEDLFDLCKEFSDEVMDAIYKISEKWKVVMQPYFLG